MLMIVAVCCKGRRLRVLEVHLMPEFYSGQKCSASALNNRPTRSPTPHRRSKNTVPAKQPPLDAVIGLGVM